ncbi:MAG: hypothetical protein QM496_10895 [Verrucomicrobiota bacterium]
MRTTIDIPDALFRKVKASAALEGKSLKDWLLRAVREELGESNDVEKTVRIRLPIVKSKELSYSISAKDVAEILDEEDREILARH